MAYEFYLADSSLYAVVTPAVRRECYEAFKQKHGSKTDQILESFREFQIARNGQQQTSGQRKQVFKKAETKLVEFVSCAISFLLYSMSDRNPAGQSAKSAWLCRGRCARR